MTESELRAACLELMAEATSACLSTIDVDGYPRTRGMLNLRNRAQYPAHMHLYDGHDIDFMVFLTTNTSSRKVREIRANPRVNIFFRHPTRTFGVSFTGRATIVEDVSIKEAVWADGWEMYYPSTGRADDPDYTVLRIDPMMANGWTGSTAFAFETKR